MAVRTSDWPRPRLYRKVNTTAHRPSHRGAGGDFRDERNSKALAQAEASRLPMHGSDKGLDYKPLFRFLISRVGHAWDEVHAEAVARLNRPDPIFWLVARIVEERQDVVRVGESSYFNGLYVDEGGTLRKVNPALSVQSLEPTCACCTHTFNGRPYARQFKRAGTAG